VRAHFIEIEPRGEFTLVIQAQTADDRRRATDSSQPASEEGDWDEARVKRVFQKLTRGGTARGDAVKQIARAAKWDRRRVYQLTMVGNAKK